MGGGEKGNKNKEQKKTEGTAKTNRLPALYNGQGPRHPSLFLYPICTKFTSSVLSMLMLTQQLICPMCCFS